MRPWHIGNTTVRSAFRLRDGLKALSVSTLIGDIKGREKEIAFAKLLDEQGVIEIKRRDTDCAFFGRKWRAALTQLGFIVPDVDEELISKIGARFTVTQNGQRLIDAESVAGIQECFLRSLSAYQIPSPLEKDYEYRSFSPLRHTLAIMLELEKKTGDSKVDILEMGLIVQLTSSDESLAGITKRIIEFRQARESSKRKRQFEQKATEEAGVKHGYKPTTFRDYADTNFRYLKATGLVHGKGRGVILVSEKHVFIEKLVQDSWRPKNEQDYIYALCQGASLPTDNKDEALVVLEDLLSQIKTRDIPFDIEKHNLNSPANISLARHEIEQLLSDSKEEDYATRQAEEWQEIVTYMDLLINGKQSKILPDGEEIKIPRSEAAAYFEWVLWRAFLAIDSLINKPYQSRRFKIDQDFLPINTAPGNGPDLIFEFDNYVVVVEVTLTENSRQEAVEGEPVRRHVAHYVKHYADISGKKVYGLFIANKIDINTAETFRNGVWYLGDGQKLHLNIVPLTLAQFKSFFEALFGSKSVNVHSLCELLDSCGIYRTCEAPTWKDKIEYTIAEKISTFDN